MTVTDVYWYTILITGIGLSIKSLELLATVREYAERAPFDWCLSGNESALYSRWSPLFRSLYSPRGMQFLIAASLVSFGGLMAFAAESGLGKTFLCVFVTVHILLYVRQGYGLDGADQMSFLIVITVVLCFLLTERDDIRQIGVWFIGLQLALSYLVSGGAKLMSKQWRSGLALQGILSTYTYGNELAHRYLLRHGTVSAVFCWMVMLFEIAFPFSLFCGRDVMWGFIAGGVMFHVIIAVTMGLNDFVWSFAAAYPSYVFISGHC